MRHGNHWPAAQSVVSYLLDTYENLEAARDIAGKTEENAKTKMKVWYNRHTRTWTFQVDKLVQVLLPTASQKLMACWQRMIPHHQEAHEHHLQDMNGQRGHSPQTFHVNMLARWDSPSAVCMTCTTIIPSSQRKMTMVFQP